MSTYKFVRLFKDSLRMYWINFRRNIYLTISIAVSLLLFLSVALYVDFQYANYEKSYKRIQDNYIVVGTGESSKLKTLEESLSSYNYILQYHGNGTGYIANGDVSADIDFNLIASDKFYSDIWFQSGLDRREDSSNIFEYEKYTLLYGRDDYRSPYEVIISEDYAALLSDNLEDVVGMQITMGIDGPNQVFKVIGVCKGSLTERRINRKSLDKLINGEQPEENLMYTAFLSEEWFKSDKDISAALYVFFKDSSECREITDVFYQLNGNSDNENDEYLFVSPEKNQNDLRNQFKASTMLKAIVMLIVALISGVNVFGTMQNSISDRKKEIGIKKALGAEDGDIMLCFLIENIFTALFSMFVAVGLACLISVCLCFYERKILLTDFTINIYSNTIVLFICYALSSVIGFSLIPAYNATQVNIIDTIRDE